MIIDFAATDPLVAYQWLTATVTPRPIAWVSTLSADGVSNLAPFSFFQVVTGHPPTVMISPLVQGDGSLKDTVRNIQDTGEFVVNLVPFALADQMNATAFGYEHGISEFERCEIGHLPAERIHPYRVQGATVSFECKVATIHPYPADKPSCHIILGEVLLAHLDESILDEKGRVDPMRLDIIARMGGKWYSRTQSDANFELARPAGWDRRS
jgi:flavin reductase (DIM6/NTAB) family NADH-FMN oxidoreductase RutF